MPCLVERLLTGSVKKLRPSICTRTVACPIHTAWISSPAAPHCQKAIEQCRSDKVTNKFALLDHHGRAADLAHQATHSVDIPAGACRRRASGLCTGKAASQSAGEGLKLSSSHPVLLGEFRSNSAHFAKSRRVRSYSETHVSPIQLTWKPMQIRWAK